MDAAAAVEAGDAEGHHFKLLFRNSDVGGARPKARIRSEGGSGSRSSRPPGQVRRRPPVEAACLDVAEAAGFPVPRRKIVSPAAAPPLFVERFDRDEGTGGRPYAYLSAATLLKQSSASYATERTYTDIASVAQAIGVKDAPASVFGRLLLNAYLHNTDDHLRNHAFIDRATAGRSPRCSTSPRIRIAPGTSRRPRRGYRPHGTSRPRCARTRPSGWMRVRRRRSASASSRPRDGWASSWTRARCRRRIAGISRMHFRRR